MPNKEKVIKGLETCIEHEDCGDCPYASTCYDPIDFAVCLMKDALALLKEQEAQSVLSNRVCEVEPFRYVRKGFCPKCHQEMEWLFNRKYCGFCGQAVKWE